MRHYTAKRILSLPSLSHMLYDDQNKFTPKRLITDLGLYEGVLIDASNILCTKTETTDFTGTHINRITGVLVSEDIIGLHRFVLMKENIMLPCAECRREMTFTPSIAFNPQLTSSITITDDYDNEINHTVINPIDKGEFSEKDRFAYKHDKEASLQLFYQSGSNIMKTYGDNEIFSEELDTSDGALSCVEGISQFYSEIRVDFECTLDKRHHVTSYFIIHKAVDVCKDQNKSDEYEKLKYCLVLEKVGQEPSMSDLQMFDIEKYKKVLSNNSFRDFSMALGLYSSGVGCASLLYLRRIYETLIKNAQDKCSSMPGWDEKEYNKRRFNEKMGYLEAFGAKIIPDELSDVKAKIYGWLSKGVHELPEQESMELFPHLKLAMEMILDEQIAQKEKEEKLKELKKTLQK